MQPRAEGVRHYIGQVAVSKMGGMVTDIDPTHLPDNRFQELINYEVKNGELHKIAGYKKYYDTIFQNPVINISQLIIPTDTDTERYLFAFNKDGVWYQDSGGVFNFFDSFLDNLTEVRTISFQNRLFGVDPGHFPFFISKEESEFDLNVWARLICVGTNTIKLVDANDITKEYRTFNIDPASVDGELHIEYNDETNGFIYILNNKWAFKFDYGTKQYKIVHYKKISDYDIIDWSFKSNSFGIIWADGGKKLSLSTFGELDNNNFWHEGDFSDMYTGLIQYHNFFPFSGYTGIGNSVQCNPYISNATSVHRLKFSVKNNIVFNLKDIYDTDVPINFSNEVLVDLFKNDFHASINYGERQTHARQTVSLYLNFQTLEYEFYSFKKDNKLYIGMRSKIYYQYRRQADFDVNLIIQGWKNVYDFDDGAPSTQTAERIDVKVYDLNDNLNDVTTTETLQDLIDIINAGTYDILLKNLNDTNNINYSDTISDTITVTTGNFENNVVNDAEDNTVKYTMVDQNFNDYFKLKNTYDNPELFYPYVDIYTDNDFAVRYIGSPGRPYALKSTGNETGTYTFFVTYITDLNGETETLRSPLSDEVVLANEGVDVYWAQIPDDYPYSILRLRIFARDMSTGEEICIAEVDNPSPEFTAEHVLIEDFTPIESFYNFFPIVPKGKLIGLHLNRLVLLGENPNEILYSDAGVPEYFPSDNQRVLKDDEDEITSWVSIYDRFIVFKNNYIYALVGDLGDSQLIKLVVSKKYGCIATDSIAVYKTTVIFLSRTGLCILNGNTVIEISNKIFNNYIFSFSEDDIKKAKGIFDNEDKYYRLYIADKVIVTDMNGNFWVEDKVDRKPYLATSYIISSNNKMINLFSTISGYIYQDKSSNFFDQKKRWAFLKSKKFKYVDFEDETIFNVLRLNSLINEGAIVVSDNLRICEDIPVKLNNYYDIPIGNVIDDDFEFNITENSPFDHKIFDMGIQYE